MDLFGEEAPAEEETTDVLLSSEPIEEFSHPRSMTTLFGHQKTEQQLLDLFNTGRMPHGLILTGAKGIGKATLAYKFARFLFKHGNIDPNQNALFEDDTAQENKSIDIPPTDPIFTRIASGGYPDLLSIERLYDATKNKTQESLAVSEIRRVEPFLRRTSSDGGWRIVLIDDADTMNRSAQNALLKILEEPPKKTLIILIAHRVGALIPTIRSRARIMNASRLDENIMSELMIKKGHDLNPSQSQILAAMSEGSFGKACDILEEGGLESFTTITSILNDHANTDWRLIHHHANQIAKAGQEQAYKNFNQTLIWLYKTLTFAKARGQTISPDALNEEPFTHIIGNSSLAQLLKICENLSSNFDMTERANLDKKQAVLKAFEIILK